MVRDDIDLTPEHARALIKQAIGFVVGDPWVVAEATAEIARIEAAHRTDRRDPPAGLEPEKALQRRGA